MKICIVGIGMMGGSLGMALKAAGVDTVYGLDNDPAVVNEAVRLRAVDGPPPTGATGPLLGDCDFVFVCTPLDAIPNVLSKLAHSLGKNTIITDIGSIKAPLTASAEEALGDDYCQFIGGHPMCGSELSGVANADRELFKGATYFLTPTEHTSTRAYSELHRLLSDIGADVIAIEPERHDHIVAAISHLPHLIAFALFELVKEAGGSDVDITRFAGGSLKDMTRVAASSPEMWSRIIAGNLKAVGETTIDFFRKIETLLGQAASDRTALEGRLGEIRNGRLRLETSRELDLEKARVLYIAVLDRPGVISEITLTMGAIGVNIEDIGIEHGAREGGGLLRLTVTDEATAFKARSALHAKGFEVTVGGLLEEADR